LTSSRTILAWLACLNRDVTRAGSWSPDAGSSDHRYLAPALLSHICMTLSAEALDIIDYLNTAPGRFVSLPEISRRAGGRQRFEASRGWAKMLLPSLLEAGLIEINERGHCRSLSGSQSKEPAKPVAHPAKRPAKIIGDDYFPTSELHGIVGGDYFPSGN